MGMSTPTYHISNTLPRIHVLTRYDDDDPKRPYFHYWYSSRPTVQGASYFDVCNLATEMQRVKKP